MFIDGIRTPDVRQKLAQGQAGRLSGEVEVAHVSHRVGDVLVLGEPGHVLLVAADRRPRARPHVAAALDHAQAAVAELEGVLAAREARAALDA